VAKRRKKATPLRRALRTTLPIVFWLVFSWWYTNTAGPLSAEEIDNYISALEAQGTDPERREMMRAFLENDTGDDFVMINLIELNRSSSIENPHAEAQAALDTYMSHMWPALLRRGCHPVTFGTSAARACRDEQDHRGSFGSMDKHGRPTLTAGTHRPYCNISRSAALTSASQRLTPPTSRVVRRRLLLQQAGDTLLSLTEYARSDPFG